MLAFMKLDKLAKIQGEANELLEKAILHDRRRSWSKMAENYKRMLRLIAGSNLPSTFIPPPSYDLLLYESYYHFGIALQNLGRHKESILAYTSALNSMNLRKNGCLAGCSSNTCFQTPVLARRGFAFAKSGDLRNGFKDIEKAVTLDSKNPDLYCVRALLWNMKKEQQRSLEDLNKALKLNQSHVGALLLRGTIDEPLQISYRIFQGISLNAKKQIHKDHEKAIALNLEASNFSDIGDLHHPKMIDFWNRFLRFLNIPRTVIRVDLISSLVTQYNTTIAVLEKSNDTSVVSTSTSVTPLVGNRAQASVNISSTVKPTLEVKSKSVPSTPFRCGTPLDSDSSKMGRAIRNRRLSYGEAVRTYTNKRQETGVSEYIQRLVEQASRRPSTSKKSKLDKFPSISKSLPATAHTSRRNSIANSSIYDGRDKYVVISTAPPARFQTPNTYSPISRQGFNIPSASPIAYNNSVQSQKLLAARSSANRRANIGGARPSHQDAANFASKVHGIEVFKDVNSADVPRMYYKPWAGDKLPIAEIPTRTKLEAFRV